MHISPAHWHLLLNHFPIIISITGTGFLVAALVIRKQHLRFGGLLLILFAAAMAYPAFATGHGAEEEVEEIAGVSHQGIHAHEDTAQTGLRIMLGAGAIALLTLFLLSNKKKAADTMVIITLCAGLISAGYMAYVGYTGGEIRHAEIRGDFGGNTSTQPADNGQQENGGGEQDDD
ncbi:MAG: hypothetical protein R2794_11805 [Chitinophagales bacterium]